MTPVLPAKKSGKFDSNDIPCILANHPYCAHDNDEDNGQDYGVLSNILAFRVASRTQESGDVCLHRLPIYYHSAAGQSEWLQRGGQQVTGAW